MLDYKNPIDGSGSGDQTFVLYRNLVDSKATFEDLMGAPNQSTLDQGEWGEVNIRNDGKNYLVSNIVDFRIEFHVEDDGDPGTPTLVTGDVFFGGTTPTVGSGAPAPYSRPLAYADITLVVISDEALQVVQNGALAQTGYANWTDYINANGEVFKRRVNFLARPLKQ